MPIKKELGSLFGVKFWAESDDEWALKCAENYILDLEARERRISHKETELELKEYKYI